MDFTAERREWARRKAARRWTSADQRPRYKLADVLALPFKDASFTIVSIAFGIRNVTDIDAALREAFRALKFGGRFVCLEFSHVEMPLLDRVYDFHSFEVIPRIGKLVTGSADSYHYLVESIRKFPDQPAFSQRIENAGFERVSYQNLTGGIAAIHSGWKL